MLLRWHINMLILYCGGAGSMLFTVLLLCLLLVQCYRQFSHLGTLILEGGLDFLPAFANQLWHNLLVIVPQREVGGDAAVVPAQQPNGSPVISPSCIVLGVIVSHRHP